MKHFTPQRWIQLQHVEDERAFYAAQAEWQRAVTGYRESIVQAAPRLPPELRQFAQGESLHDATVLGDWRGRSRLCILVRPERPTHHLVLLTYTLVEPPRVAFVLPAEYRSEGAGWMYDEVGIEEETGPDADPIFTHAILLRDGREIRLRFRRFTYSRPEPGLPLPDALLLDSASPLSHSA
jgi:hypothetical protein